MAGLIRSGDGSGGPGFFPQKDQHFPGIGLLRPPPSVSAQSHILVVDDEPLAAQGLASFLTHKGYRVTATGDGREALGAFRADPAEIVITDIRMPKLDGWDLIRSLRSTSSGTYIIAVTGYYAAGDTEKATSAGANTIMRKPLDLRAICSTLDSLAATKM